MKPEPQITSEILKLIAEIDEFKGQWRALRTLSPEVLNQLRQVATIESIGSSTRIEGSKLSNKEVAELLSNLRAESFRSRDEEEVAGYAAAMEMVFASWEVITPTENHIRQLHRVLLQHSTKDERHRGDYKKTPNNVVAKDVEGNIIGVVFETATPFDTPREMETLVGWLKTATDDGDLHPLLIVGIFAVRFLAIHPFQDGNGRLSRILTTLLLLRFGYAYVPYSSLESIIEDNKGSYYASLRRTQQSMKSGAADWEPWLVFFLRCLVWQKQKLEKRIESEATIISTLSGLSLAIVNLLAERGQITVAGVVAATNANRNTVKAVLQGLVKKGLIMQRGKGRGVHYTLA